MLQQVLPFMVVYSSWTSTKFVQPIKQQEDIFFLLWLTPHDFNATYSLKGWALLTNEFMLFILTCFSYHWKSVLSRDDKLYWATAFRELKSYKMSNYEKKAQLSVIIFNRATDTKNSINLKLISHTLLQLLLVRVWINYWKTVCDFSGV